MLLIIYGQSVHAFIDKAGKKERARSEYSGENHSQSCIIIGMQNHDTKQIIIIKAYVSTLVSATWTVQISTDRRVRWTTIMCQRSWTL